MNSEKRQRIYKSIMLVFLSILITFILTTAYMYKYLSGTESTKYVLVSNDESSIGSEITKLRTVIDKYYLGEVDDSKLREAAISGYISGLGDEYSTYISKDKYENFSTTIMGNYVGIGIYMAVYKDSDEIVIVSPIQDSPAEKAGLQAGDIIVKVDGISYTGTEGLEEASNKIKGEAGIKVNLEIKRDEELLNFEIERKKIAINPVIGEIFEDTIGYIQVTSFDEDVSEEFKSKYEELSNKGIKSLIIDLRNNGGGIVGEALSIADYIVPEGRTLMITINKTKEEKTEYAKQRPIINIPVVVLVNENSASASEILVGALKDNKCAQVVGTKTYGKGVIQEVLRLTDGGALKLTTEEYFTPNRSKINKIGIEPDEEVKLPEGVQTSYNIERSKDTQLDKAIEMLK